jgi:hypothetical protein
MSDARSMRGRRGSGAVRVAPGGCGRRSRAHGRGGAADGTATRGSGRRVPSAADPVLLPRVCPGGGAHRAERPLAVPGEMPEAQTVKAPHRPGARRVLVGEAVEAPPGEGGGDARRSGMGEKVLPCATLPAPATGALAVDLGEAVGIDAREAGLPRGHDDDGSNPTGGAGRARSRTSFSTVGQSVNQLLLAAAPLPVAARARFDARAEAVRDRTGSLRGCHTAGGRRLRLHLRRGAEQDVAVGGARGGVAQGRNSPSGSSSCGVEPSRQRSLFPLPPEKPLGWNGAASGERVWERLGGGWGGWSPALEWGTARVGRGDLERGSAGGRRSEPSSPIVRQLWPPVYLRFTAFSLEQLQWGAANWGLQNSFADLTSKNRGPKITSNSSGVLNSGLYFSVGSICHRLPPLLHRVLVSRCPCAAAPAHHWSRPRPPQPHPVPRQERKLGVGQDGVGSVCSTAVGLPKWVQ